MLLLLFTFRWRFLNKDNQAVSNDVSEIIKLSSGTDVFANVYILTITLLGSSL
jgi:hypothetical protein